MSHTTNQYPNANYVGSFIEAALAGKLPFSCTAAIFEHCDKQYTIMHDAFEANVQIQSNDSDDFWLMWTMDTLADIGADVAVEYFTTEADTLEAWEAA